MADLSLAGRIAGILALHPELAGHFGSALAEAGLIARAATPDHQSQLLPVLQAHGGRLRGLAQDAARRFDHLPVGVSAIVPTARPPELVFDPTVQPVIDAPLVAAEMAAGRRPAPTPAEVLTLINLRLTDPAYFDAAVPAALARLVEAT